MEFAWEHIVGNTSALANPFEYQTTMYELFFNGNAPAQREDKDGKPGKPALTPKTALDELAAVREMAKRLREEQAPD